MQCLPWHPKAKTLTFNARRCRPRLTYNTNCLISCLNYCALIFTDSVACLFFDRINSVCHNHHNRLSSTQLVTMLLLGHFETRGCRAQTPDSRSLTLKQSRFWDAPIWLMLDTEARLWAITGDWDRRIQLSVEQNLTSYLLSSFCIKFALRVHQMSREIIRSVAISSKCVVVSKKTTKSTSPVTRRKRRAPASLLSLPAELRTKIFAYVTEDAEMKVVGYRRGTEDSFYFKARGTFLPCPGPYHSSCLDLPTSFG